MNNFNSSQFFDDFRSSDLFGCKIIQNNQYEVKIFIQKKTESCINCKCEI